MLLSTPGLRVECSRAVVGRAADRAASWRGLCAFLGFFASTAAGCSSDAAPRDVPTLPGLRDAGAGQTPRDAGPASHGGGGDGATGPGPGATDAAVRRDGSIDNKPPACDASAAPALTRLGLSPVVHNAGLSALVYAAQPPDSNDWYLVELTGRIKVWSDGAVRPMPLLDVSGEISLSAGYDERGLYSIAFAPDYKTSGRFYVAMTPTTGATANHDLILEYKRSSADPFVADPASRRAILDLPPQGQAPTFPVNWNSYHNLGTLMFGPDGMLYAGHGDGGGECNAANPGAPQDIGSPFGKILRLDPSAPAPHAAAGNPFKADGDARVLHYGFRNPFRFGFDSATGDLYIADVGQWDFDWVEVAPAGSTGLNFGWPAHEGTATDTCQGAASLRAGSSRTEPVHVLEHGAAGGAASLNVAIVGGTVYRGKAIPELYGAYLYGEYYPSRPMGALFHCGGQTSEVTSIRKVCDPNVPEPCFVSQGGAPALAEVGAIVEGNDGELYIPGNRSTLFKIVPAK